MADTLNETNGTKAKTTAKRAVRKTVASGETTARKVKAQASTSATRVKADLKTAAVGKKSVKDTVREGAATVKAAALKATENVDWKAQGDQIKEQATKTARAAAGAAKETTGGAMHSLSKLIADTAGTVDAKLGPQYGDYARYAAEAVAGAAKSLDAKDVDQLVGDARDFVRKSPAVAIGAAAVVGYVLMRLAKGSGSDEA
ncbi:hypothetical protein [Sphingobium algorifonticola]|uniref:DUF883 family protein n=1 Tax=Sphingobium algorifonticola TaxID=2008318 RepID=A0A437JB37_9SPHN|nr:hypothetical protein [Sphingobium algorifonticola]RVT43127.1 hypothetical protein ENE74_00340 [Sphingobium algorifonticola]